MRVVINDSLTTIIFYTGYIIDVKKFARIILTLYNLLYETYNEFLKVVMNFPRNVVVIKTEFSWLIYMFI